MQRADVIDIGKRIAAASYAGERCGRIVPLRVEYAAHDASPDADRATARSSA